MIFVNEKRSSFLPMTVIVYAIEKTLRIEPVSVRPLSEIGVRT